MHGQNHIKREGTFVFCTYFYILGLLLFVKIG